MSSFRVNNGPIRGEVKIGDGIGMKLWFRGHIYSQHFAEFTEIKNSKHYSDIAGHSVLGSPSMYGGKTDAYLTTDGILEHQYPKHEELLVGTLCRYGHEIGEKLVGGSKFLVDFTYKDGVHLIVSQTDSCKLDKSIYKVVGNKVCR